MLSKRCISSALANSQRVCFSAFSSLNLGSFAVVNEPAKPKLRAGTSHPLCPQPLFRSAQGSQVLPQAAPLITSQDLLPTASLQQPLPHPDC